MDYIHVTHELSETLGYFQHKSAVWRLSYENWTWQTACRARGGCLEPPSGCKGTCSHTLPKLKCSLVTPSGHHQLMSGMKKPIPLQDHHSNRPHQNSRINEDRVPWSVPQVPPCQQAWRGSMFSVTTILIFRLDSQVNKCAVPHKDGSGILGRKCPPQ